jgi:signal transduction histidine kinase
MCDSAPKSRSGRATMPRIVLGVGIRSLMGTVEVEAGSVRSELIAIVAHELRYPLVPIRNAAALLQRDVVDAATIRRAAGIIERQVTGMNRLIGDLVDVSRMQQGILEIRRARAPLSALVEWSIESAQAFANERGHSLCVSVSPEPVYLEMDLLRVSQALVNIIANATRYTQAPGNILVRAQREGARAMIIVSDTGIGIAKAELEAIFGLFAKSAQGTRVEQGLGIGLYLARHFIEAHGGTVTAASAGIGRGSDFTIRLPCEVPATPRPADGGVVPRGDPTPA